MVTKIELLKLPEWALGSAPLDLGDWVAQIEHIMGDLTSSSSIWWSTLLGEAKAWYEEHQTLGPLEKLSHKPVASTSLAKQKWTRLDRRVTSSEPTWDTVKTDGAVSTRWT